MINYSYKEVDGQLRILNTQKGLRPFWSKGVWQECWSCGKLFPILATDANRGRNHFCSRKCFGAWRSKLAHQQQLGKRCPYCHRWFKLNRTLFDRIKTCRRPECSRQAKSDGMKAFLQRRDSTKVR